MSATDGEGRAINVELGGQSYARRGLLQRSSVERYILCR
jgi:hypothetical protein